MYGFYIGVCVFLGLMLLGMAVALIRPLWPILKAIFKGIGYAFYNIGRGLKIFFCWIGRGFCTFFSWLGRKMSRPKDEPKKVYYQEKKEEEPIKEEPIKEEEDMFIGGLMME